jgi:hypothetical protein
MARRKSFAAFLCGATLLAASPVWAGDKTWTGATNTTWSTGTNWNPAGAPGINDRAIIPNLANKPIVTASTTIGQLLVQPAATVTINNGVNLTINGTSTGNLAASPVIDGVGTVRTPVAGGSGVVTVTGGLSGGIVINDSITLPNFTLNTPAATSLGVTSAKAVTFTGNLIVQQGQMQVGAAAGAASTLSVSGLLNVNAGGTLVMLAGGSVLNLTGNLTFAGTWTPGTSTLNLTPTAGQTLTLTGGPYSFYNVVVNSTSNLGNNIDGQLVTLSAGCTILNDLTLTRGEFVMGNIMVDVFGNIASGLSTQSQLKFSDVGTIRVRGNVDLGGFSNALPGSATVFSTLIMNGTTPQTFLIRATTASDFHDMDNFRVSNPAGVTVLNNPNANWVVHGTTTLDANCSLTIQNTFQVDGPVVFAAGGGNTLRLEEGFAGATPLGSSLTAGTGTVVYAGQGVSQTVYTVTGSSNPILYYNVTIDNTAGTVATQQAGTLLDVEGSFTIQTANATFTASAGNMAVAKNFTANGTFNAGAFTVTMDGTGTIGGTAASLTFNNLFVSGATIDVVTAARNFTTNNTFQVVQGALNTAGSGTAITLTAQLGMLVGDGAGGAGTASFNLLGADTLAIAPARTFSVNAADGRFTSLGLGPPYDNSPARNPTLTRSAAGSFSATVNGQANLMGLNFSFGDANGLNFAATSTIERLRNARFTHINAAAGSHHLTISSPGLDLDCPGCFFDTVSPGSFNVWAMDTNVGNGIPVRLRFEDRTSANAPTAIGGPGAGDAFTGDDDTDRDGLIDHGETTAVHGGAIVQWVYTANIDMTGAIQGFPEPAFDWNTFSYYSTYAVMRQAAGGPDTLYLLDSNGDVRPGASFSPGAAAGNILGPLYWDTEGAIHVVYFGTSLGFVYKLVDNGAGLAPPALPSPWNTPFSDATLALVSTPVISDRTNVYFGGNDNQNPGNSTAHWGMYRIQISTKTMPIGRINLQKVPVTNASSWADGVGGRAIYQASNALSGVSNIYRIQTASWLIDATVTSTTSFLAPTNVPLDTVFVGEQSGWMHAIAALGTPAQFVSRTGFPFTVNASPVTGGAVWDMVNVSRLPALTGGRLFFGNGIGELFTLYLYPASWTLGTNYYRTATPGGQAIQSMPLVQDGMIYLPSTGGKLFLYDADTGAGPALARTYNLFGSTTTGDVSRDSIGSGRIYVGTTARLYSILPFADPTPLFR